MTRKYIIVADDSLKGFDEGIEDLERKWGAEEIEPCEDCISRTELLSRIDAERKYLLNFKMDGAEHIIVHHARRIIEDMPSVTPQPKTGRWTKLGKNMFINLENAREQYRVLGYPHRNELKLRCSECRMVTMVDESIAYNYCPNCGAKMEVSE